MGRRLPHSNLSSDGDDMWVLFNPEAVRTASASWGWSILAHHLATWAMRQGSREDLPYFSRKTGPGPISPTPSRFCWACPQNPREKSSPQGAASPGTRPTAEGNVEAPRTWGLGWLLSSSPGVERARACLRLVGFLPLFCDRDALGFQ